MGRKPKNEKPATKTASKKKRDNDELANLAEIEAKLLKKAKANGGWISQQDIYDALNDYELDDDAIEDLIEYFAKQKIDVVNEDADAEEDEEDEEEDFDESKMSEEDDLDDDEFYVQDDESENPEDLDFDLDNLDSTVSGDVKVNDSVKTSY